MSNKELKKTAPAPKEVNPNETNDGGFVVEDAASSITYTVNDDGVFKKKAGEDSVRLCDSIKLIAHTRDANQANWGILISFKDGDGCEHELVLQRKWFSQGRKVDELLHDMGLHIDTLGGNFGKSPLAEFFNAVPFEILPRSRSVTGGGYASKNFDSFVFANEILQLPEATEKIKLAAGYDAAMLVVKGTLKDWQVRVSTPAKHSKRLMFGLCAALAAPLLSIVGVPSGLFHFYGKSGCGKTSILKAAASVFGGEERLLSWNATGNGLEGLAQLYNDQPLILDEIGQAKDSTVQAVYDLANGVERARKTRDARLRNVSRWHINVLSSGEFSLPEIKQQKARRGAEDTASGELVRFLCIPADAGSGLGVLDSLPDDPNFNDRTKQAAAFVDSFSSLDATGSAGRQFLLRLMEDVNQNGGMESLKEQLDKTVKWLEEKVVSDRPLKSAERRVLVKFSVVALAGELARGYGVFGEEWKEGDAVDAVAECFKSWRNSDESPDERNKRNTENLLDAPIMRKANYSIYSPDNDGYTCEQEPKNETAGYVVLGKRYDMTTQIAQIYLVRQFDDLCKEFAPGNSRNEVIDNLEKGGHLYQGNTERRGQYQLRKKLFGLPKGKRCYVLMPDQVNGRKEFERILERGGK